MKHYKYRYLKKARPEVYRPSPIDIKDPDEGLSGYVDGKEASDLEERFAIALSRYPVVTGYRFSVPIYTPFQIPGQLNEIDFLVFVGNWIYPIEIDGEFSHKTAEQRAGDMVRDQMLDPELKRIWPQSMRIRRVPGTQLQTIDDARNLVRSLF